MCIKVTALNSTPFVPSEKAQYSKPQFCTVISQKFVLVKFFFLHGYSGRLKVAYQLRESDILNTSTGFTLSRWSWVIYSGHSEPPVAVTTQCGSDTKEPPQKGKPKIERSWTCHGQSPFTSPTILECGRIPQEPWEQRKEKSLPLFNGHSNRFILANVQHPRSHSVLKERMEKWSWAQASDFRPVFNVKVYLML